MKLRGMMAAAAVIGLAGCASRPNAPAAEAADKYVGEWRSNEGVFVNCFRREDDVYVLRSNRSGEDRMTEGELIDIEGTMMLKVKVYEPAKEEAEKGMVPLYIFGVLSQKGDVLKHTPIRAAWLAKAMREHDAGQFVGTNQAMPGTGVGIAPDWPTMEHILRDAVTEEGALGGTETFVRVK